MGKSEVGRVGAWGKEAGMPKAIAHGPEFPNPANMPQSMTDALRQASQTDAGIYHVDAAGAETLQTYSTLWKDAAQIAAGLQSCGLGAGDFVILQFSSNVDFIAALWGCFLRGCTPAPISAYPSSNQAPPLFAALQLLEHPLFLTDQRLSASLSSTLETRALKDRPQALNPSTEPSRLLTIEKLRHIGSKSSLGDFLAADFQADDLALLLLTSGSTGEPKGVMLTHQNLQASVYGMATVNRLSAADITLNWMPLEHVASLVMFHITEVFLGCSQVHVANEWVLKAPLTWLDLIERYRATATWAPNFAYGLVNQQEAVIKQRHWDLTSLRWMGNGAEAVVGRTTRRFLQLLEPHGLAPTVVSPGYGMSETCSGIVHSDQFSLESTSDDDVWVNVGAPIPGVSMRIVDESNQLAQEGETGQLQVKGLTVMTGYYQRPDLNAEAFTADGWLKTGDLGFLQNGRLTITGRQKDVIILNGVNYYSLEIERAVNGLEGVDATLTAACGVRRLDDVTDQLAIFFHPLLTPIAAQTDPAPIIPLVRRIRGQVAQQIGVSPAYVIPVEAEEIPKTSIGKIQRSKLSQQFASGAFETRVQQVAQALKAEHRQASDRPRTDLERQIAEIWRSVLKIEAVGNHDNFFELGGTSLGLMQVLNRLQTTIAPTLTAVTLFQQSTVATLAAYLNQEAASQQPLKVRSHLRAQTSHQTDVAVIGMAGRFPGANNLQEFWRNLCDGVESISSFTDDEILASGIPPSLLQHPNYVKASPILEDVDYFDAAFFGYSPKEAELTDPQQRLLLECAWESLETAGYNPLTYAGSIGLYAGASMNTYLLNHVYPQRHTLDPNDPLEVFTLSSLGGFQATVANDKDYLTTRVSYKLNLRGPSVNVQTACSTALTAVHMAAQSVLQGECDLALAGGVSVETPQRAGYLYQDGMILSPDGHCRAFDAQAQGTLFGSGVGLVVLKRLDAAIADRDFIYAVIKGSAMGNDGGQKVGYLAPRSEGQATVAAEALAIANIPADTLGYVEAHGTGTALGDPIEIAGLTQAFSLTTSARQFCPIGSVKTNVGHLNIASGIVGFIKTVLALHHRQIPASLHFEQANPQIDFTNSPFYVNTSLANWPKGETPRRASVNSLGIGGTNVHVVLEEADGNGNEEFRQALAPATQPLTTVFTLSAKDQTALRALGRRYLTFLSDHPHLSIADVCFTANTGRAHFSHRQAFVADSAECLRDQLRDWLSDNPDGDTNDSHTENESNGSPSGNSLEIAFLFTGQGAQSVNMGRTLYDTQPVFRETLNRCAAILKTFDIPLLALIYPDLQPETDLQQSETEASPLPDVATDPASQLAQTIHTQPALFAIEYALAQLWISWGVRPSAVLGHSVGEYVAACLAGVFSLEDALKLIATRGRLMQQLPAGGAMVSVETGQAISQAVIEVCGNEAAIAAINGPQSTVISGSARAIARIIQEFDDKGVKHTPLKVSHAFHSPLMEPMLTEFRQVAETIVYQAPTLDVVSNLSGTIADDSIATPDYWVNHVRQPVRFAQGVETLHHSGYRTFLECGPRPVLLSLAQAIPPLSPNPPQPSWLPSLHPKKPDSEQMLASLAAFYRQGADINWAAFYAPQSHRRIPLPTYPFQRRRHWMDRPLPPLPLQTPRPSSHPLLGHRISTPLNHTIFQNTLTQNHPRFLADHLVQHLVIFPGAAYLEMGRAAGSIALKTDAICLRTVEISRSLVLSEQPQTLQTVLSPEKGGYSFRIYSSGEPEGSTTNGDLEWVLHCEGAIAPIDRSVPEPLGIEILKQGLSEWSAEVHYALCERLGLLYNGPFRTVQMVWRRDHEALGRIRISHQIVGESSSDHLSSALLDACFQIVLAALPESALFGAYVPIGVESLYRYQPLPSKAGEIVWSHVQLKPQPNASTEVVEADVQILSANGQVAVLAVGLAAKRVQRASLRPASPTTPWRDWLYRIDWRPMPGNSLDETPISDAPGNWLIYAHHPATLKAISNRLEAQRRLCIQGSLGNPDENADGFEQLLDLIRSGSPLEAVVYFAGQSSEQASESLNRTVQTICQNTLRLVQALGSPTVCQPPPQLWLVTRGAQAVVGDENLSVAQSPLGGMGKTIALEHPELACVCLDLDPDCDENQALDHLAAEFKLNKLHPNSQSRDTQIAYRQGVRYTARLTPAALLDSNTQHPASPKSAAIANLQTNQQLQISTRGSLEHLEWRLTARRPPKADEVEIRVQAAGLNFRDLLNALGLYPGDAGALGLECVGEVTAVGADVQSVQVNDRVMAIAPASFSQYVTVSAELVAPQPANLLPEEAATLPTAFLTAYYALCQVGQMKRGDRVLIHAAAGGVGQAAVQLAQQIGVEVFATASPQKWTVLQQQGVRHCFNSRTLDFAEAIMEATNGDGVTLALNSLAGEAIPKSLSVLAANGRFLEIGKTAVWSTEQVAQYRPDVDYHIIDLVAVTDNQPRLIQSMLRHIADQVQTGSLRPLPFKTFAAHQVIDAFRWMQQAKQIGKVVVTAPPTAKSGLVSSANSQASVGTASRSTVISPNATYLITGGMGVLGLRVAEHLADSGARHLILLGRNQPQGHHTQPRPETQQVIRRLTQDGVDVQILHTDLLHLPTLKSSLSPFLNPTASSPPPLKGVFHLAGQLDDGILLQQTWERFESVIAAKAQGTWHLHQLTQTLDLDHFVLFSSAASLIGSAGQANYAAANAFLDAIAHLRHQAGLPALSINWGAWAGGGLAANPTVKQRLIRQGIDIIAPKIGLEILTHLMAADITQVGVLPGQQWAKNPNLFFADIEPRTDAAPAQTAPAPNSGGIVEQILAATGEDRGALLTAHLQRQTATVLGTKAAQLKDLHCSFTDLGIDSLTSVELRNRLQTSLNRTFPVGLIYDYPTLAALRDYLLGLIAPQESPTPDKSIPPPANPGKPPKPDKDRLDKDFLGKDLLEKDLETLSEDEAERLLLEELKRLDY